MNENEMKHLAEQGDVQAMLSLGDYYYDQKDYVGLENALSWYEKAADTGNIYGVQMSIALCQGLALLNQSESFGCWEEALQYWNSAKKWISLVLDNTDSNDEDHIKARADFDECALWTAYSSYRIKNYVAAMESLQGLTGIVAKLLQALCKRRTAQNHNDHVNAYYALCDFSLLQPQGYEEEYILFWAAFDLAAYYRLGLINVLKPNLTQSVAVLNIALQKIKDNKLGELLTRELGKYRKGMFGGYKYTE